MIGRCHECGVAPAASTMRNVIVSYWPTALSGCHCHLVGILVYDNHTGFGFVVETPLVVDSIRIRKDYEKVPIRGVKSRKLVAL